MSRKGIHNDERIRNSTQGSLIGGIISIFCVMFLATRTVHLVLNMFDGSNDIIKNGLK